MKAETLAVKFANFLLEWGRMEINPYKGIRKWRAGHIRYTGLYSTEEMFKFFKLGKKWTDEE